MTGCRLVGHGVGWEGCRSGRLRQPPVAALERPGMHLQDLGGAGTVAMHHCKHAFDVTLLQVTEAPAAGQAQSPGSRHAPAAPAADPPA